MSASAQRPLIFLDVDGPLIPFGAAPQELPPGGYPEYPACAGPRPPDSHPLLGRIDPGLGPRLAALPGDLVWATTWTADANECVAPRLGLPQLPVVWWDEPSEEGPSGGTHWKTPALVAWAAGRPFAWIDDEITGADRRWVAAHHPGRSLLHRVDPRRGLLDADFAALGAWLRTAAPGTA